MESLLSLYALHKSSILEAEHRFAEALEEDHLKNADMFDITRTAFSANRHPNVTMRALEKELSKADLPFLYLLTALCETGLELTQGLADLHSPAEFARSAAERYRELEKRAPSAGLLAQRLTEIKAEHVQKRLRAAILQMEQTETRYPL